MGKVSATERSLVGVASAADRLGLSVHTLRNWCYQGRCASHKLGDKLMISSDEVERIIAESERPRLMKAAS